MAQDLVTIFNLALSAAGSKATITDPTSDKSREAQLCNLWYDLVRQTVIKSASWPCSLAHSALGVAAERGDNTEWADGDPAPGYRFAYHEPQDMLAPRYLSSYAPFTRTNMIGQNVINSNACGAVLCYTRDNEKVSQWDVGLRHSIINTLGAYISLDLSGKSFIYDRLIRQAQVTVLQHQTDIANENEELMETIPSWIEAGHYTGVRPTTQYYFPYENLNGISK